MRSSVIAARNVTVHALRGGVYCDEKNRKNCGKRKKVLAFSKMIQYNLDS